MLAGDAHHSSTVGDRVAHWPLSDCQRRVHRKAFSQKRKLKISLSGLGGRPCESADACDARGVSADSGGIAAMRLEDAIERDPGGVVFIGTSIPINLLFDFLEDDQTVDTFLDQFPMVSRDQARAVLGASRDMLLSTSSSEV